MQARPTWGQLAASVLLALALHDGVGACNVPVFRYALERWRPDMYRVLVVQRGALDDAQQKLVEQLRRAADDGVTNFALATVDLEQLGDAAGKLIGDLSDADLPRLVVQYPVRLGSDAPIWSAPLTAEAVAGLVDSPARQELTRRLIGGQSAVWIVLESGDRDADDAAVTLVERELRTLEKELKLPQLTDDPIDKLAAAPPLVIDFSVLRLSRGEVEAPLLQMLLRSESDLAAEAAPLVFPVFGRGRAMFPLVGAGITAENIRDFSSFLVGACSCQVKEFNPGFDLLITANWDERLALVGERPTLAAATRPAPPDEPVLVPIPRSIPRDEPGTASGAGSTEVGDTGAAPPAADRSHAREFLVTGIVAGVALGLTFALVALARRRSATVTRG